MGDNTCLVIISTTTPCLTSSFSFARRVDVLPPCIKAGSRPPSLTRARPRNPKKNFAPTFPPSGEDAKKTFGHHLCASIVRSSILKKPLSTLPEPPRGGPSGVISTFHSRHKKHAAAD